MRSAMTIIRSKRRRRGDRRNGCFRSSGRSLIVIDAESEGLDERPVVDRVRMVTDIPLVVLSPSAQLEDRLIGLRAGADEVMAKPFLLSELACKVTALIRRNGHRSAIVELGDLVVDEGAHTVERRGRARSS